MRKRGVLIVLAISLGFNITFLFFMNAIEMPSADWLFTDLGPALMQDSYQNRAPSLESPFGMIGDLPGGYSFYVGNPLQTGPENLSAWILQIEPGEIQTPALGFEMMLGALIIALCPLVAVIILGRKSFGVAKTQ